MERERININSLGIITSGECCQEVFLGVSRGLEELCNAYNLQKPLFSKESIFCGKENFSDDYGSSTLTSIIFSKIKEITSDDDTALHCLISGGRKTMSFDAVSALNIFARRRDRAYHVLASPEFEKTGRYFPENEKEAGQIKLINKPFLRLREKLPEFSLMNARDIENLFEETQKEVNNFVQLDDLILNTKEKALSIGDVSIRLQPLQFAIYLFFFRQKQFIKGGKNISRTNSRSIMRAYRSVSPSKGQTDRVFRTTFHNEIIDFDVVQKAISSIASKIRKALKNKALAEFYIICSEGAYADKYYGIRLPKDKRKIINK